MTTVAFVCTHNACRSQMSEALARTILPDWVTVCSAGTDPAESPDVGALAELRRRGIRTEGSLPQRLEDLPDVDWLVTMGCGVTCPTLPCSHREDWGLDDPMGGPAEGYVACADTIVKHLTDLRERLEEDHACDCRNTTEADVFKALADERRLAIVRSIGERGEACACELLEGLDISQSTLSHHMKILCASGLVRCRRDGRWCYYSIDAKRAMSVSETFGRLAKATPRTEGGCPRT